MDIESTLLRLANSKFRASFHLKSDDIEYIKTKGWDTIQAHCYDFITKRLAPAVIANDGKQTPTHGHPVFKAMHATACCCRGCLNKWYRVPLHKELTETEQQKIVNLLMAWIERNKDK